MMSPPNAKKTPWPKKLESYLKRGETKKNPNLTQESLEEFNRINEILYEQKKPFISTGKSPYYTGLTNSSLILNRQKLSGPSSPGRESDVASVASSSISSFIVKMKGSCFNSPGVDGKAVQKDVFVPSRKKDQIRKKTCKETTLTTLGKEMGLEGNDTRVNTTKRNDFLLLKKKPLRERDSNTPSPKPSPPQPKPSLPTPKPSLTPPKQSSPPQTNELPPKQRLDEHAVFTSPLTNLLSSRPPPAKPPVSTPPWEHSSPPSILSLSLQPIVHQSSHQPPIMLKSEQKPPPAPPQPQGSPINKTKEKTTENIAQEKNYVWADRYRPATLKDFICNRDKARELQTEVKCGDCGHFIFEGPTGVGKRTMIWALLREAFGPDRVQTREEVKQFVLQGEAVGSIKVAVKMSLQHIEISLSEIKGYEKHVIVELIQETITRISNNALQCNKENCRVIILYEADKLSTDALSYIKWQLERHTGCSKVFFCCTDASKLQPIFSLCNVVKLLPPSNEEITDVLEFIAEQEGIEFPHELAVTIANNSKNNLRQAIRSFEATCDHNHTLKEDQMILTGWEDVILNIAKSIVEEQSPRQLYNVRGKLQNLIEHNVCPEYTFEGLVKELKKCSAEEFHPHIDTLYKKYKNIETNRHPEKKNLQHFMTIEEFIAKFMSCYKTSTTNKRK